jgi:hypothetical protein
MTRTPKRQPVKLHPRCQRMWDLLASKEKGSLDVPTLEGIPR